MEKIHFHEVTPRDGLQNEKAIVSTADKIQLIEKLIDAGYQDIEITSFVRPSWIPQLADSEQVARHFAHYHTDTRFWALIPNRRGLERALDAGIRHIATFMSASETHNRKNLNRTQRESLATLEQVIGIAKDEQLQVRAYLSTVFGCPYEGAVSVPQATKIAKRLFDMGADVIALGDTTGMGNPWLVQQVLQHMQEANIPVERIALHLHDTRGTALANALAGYQAGVRTFDGSTAGVGGCPYAPGASGNAATEDLAQMFEGMGCPIDIQLSHTAEVAQFLTDILGRTLPGRYHRVLLGNLQRARQSA